MHWPRWNTWHNLHVLHIVVAVKMRTRPTSKQRHCQWLATVCCSYCSTRQGEGRFGMFRQGAAVSPKRPTPVRPSVRPSVVWTAAAATVASYSCSCSCMVGSCSKGWRGPVQGGSALAATIYPAMTSSGVETGDQASLTQRQNTIDNLPTGKLCPSASSSRKPPSLPIATAHSSKQLAVHHPTPQQ